VRDDERFCPPVDVVEENPAHLTTSQSINGDQKQDARARTAAGLEPFEL